MRVKRYVAETLQDAMLKVKMDMGKDAVILHTRKFKEGGFFGFFGKVMFEVTAAVEDTVYSPAPAVHSKNQPEVHALPANGEKDGQEEMPDIQEELKEMKSMLSEVMTQIDVSQDLKAFPKSMQKQYQIMIENDVEDRLAKKLLKDAMKKLGQEETAETVRECLDQQIIKILKKPKPITFKKLGLSQQLIALVGPTGVGKTTTIAKLAATFSIVDKKKVALITADTYRVAAVEQLKTYGEIIGIPIDVVYTPQELQDALAKHTDKDLILIDTAGRSHKNTGQMIELQSFIEAAGPTDIFLVLSATTKYKDMQDIVNSYSDIEVTRLVFTKLDETSSLGAILNVVSNTQKCLSYVTAGQNVPDDIEVADPVKIANMITGER
ncbi:MAG: flagellar biosynthesis protein FlhF [Firmicutes bacterium HGW-Firmicutes-14]|nr:MAG: flagellar biosynthesis protein FlhF [Firmicutes bacterium HGW-Firmicutes-14]